MLQPPPVFPGGGFLLPGGFYCLIDCILAQHLFGSVEVTGGLPETVLEVLIFLLQIVDSVVKTLPGVSERMILTVKGRVFCVKPQDFVFQLYIGTEQGTQDDDDLLPYGLEPLPVGFGGFQHFWRRKERLRVCGEFFRQLFASLQLRQKLIQTGRSGVIREATA